MKKRIKFLCKTDTSATYPISRYVKNKMKSASNREICTPMFIVAILTTARLYLYVCVSVKKDYSAMKIKMSYHLKQK